MSEPRRFTYQTLADLPSDAALLRELDREHHVVLQFPSRYEPAKADLIRDLQQRLPEFCSVFDSGGSPDLMWITIMQVISRPELEALEDELIESARLFRRTARALAHRWADHNGVEAAELEKHLPRLKPLPGPWKMDHHGGHQRFIHQVTGQVVEVGLWFGGEFGVLDPQFFHTFLRTTPDLRCPPELRDAYHDTARALDYLEERGLLRRIQGRFDFEGRFAP